MIEGAAEFRAHWRALLGCTMAASVGVVGLNAYTNGAFVPELVATAGYSREQLSTATLMLSAAVALVAPLMGQALDRWGPVRVITLAAVGEIVGLLLLALSPAGFGWYAGLLVALALLGVGSTPPSFSRVVTACFDRRRGLALGLMIGGLGITAIVAPILMTKVIAAAGWRGGYAVLAVLVLLLGGGGVALIRSDDYGRTGTSATTRARRGGDWSGVRRPLYWLVLLCFACPALFGGGFLLHMITILRARGFTAGEAAQVQALIGLSIILGRCLSGLSMDRIFAPYVAGIAFAISAGGTALLLSTSGPLLCAAALGIGLTIGAELDILAFTLSRYFGVASFGRLYSLAYSLMILAGGVSPVLIARLSMGGDYRPAILLCASGLALFAAVVAFLPRFERSGTTVRP
ncbi:MFS transporter [Sphingomonas bacterium]|uniref:MFS transporter n=1 Tax=Sphingomonas bacterium TaxID=1895847 RepID=UPI00157651EB|nr:MFS transporter [Sphingomonas bacterium]